MLRGNPTGTFLCARTVARSMIKARRRHREYGVGPRPRGSCERRALRRIQGRHHRTDQIAGTRWAPHGIRVNCVIPGITGTAQPRGEMSDEQLHAMGTRIPLGRIGNRTIAGVVAFLLGKDSAYMTGQSVAANGGAIMIP